MAVGLAYVLESLERSAFYASDLAEIAINHSIESADGNALVGGRRGAPAELSGKA